VIGFVTYHTVHDAIFKSYFCRQITGTPGASDFYGDIEHERAYGWPCDGMPRDT